jgi:CxxC motif-containing protein (DUF1111 family)
MRAEEASTRIDWSARVGLCLGVFVVLGGWCATARADAPASERQAEGRELFLREWMPRDSRSHGGDGLGPVYNDTSCVACHNAGGPGGGGPKSKNVDIISAFPNRRMAPFSASEPAGFFVKALTALTGIESPRPARPGAPTKPDTRELIKAHAGFRTARSVVLHRFGIEPGYQAWRQSMLGLGQFGVPTPAGMILGQVSQAQQEIDRIKMLHQFPENMNNRQQIGPFSLVRSQRNATALFGAGLIDAIGDEVLEAAAQVGHPERPEIAGRLSRQKDGTIGRFGWKAQTPHLDNFVRTACAVELGLEVPGHRQGGLPQAPEAKAAGLDLTDQQCTSLLAFVGSLPKPLQLMPSSASERATVASGRAHFDRVGCAACHRQKLGEVDGIYSDLLLHDMGADLGDTGAYGVFVPDSSEPDLVDSDVPAAVPGGAGAAGGAVTGTTIEVAAVPGQLVDEAAPIAAVPPAKRPTGPATRQEWRTPPLWGFRDSGPYMHDGRAATLEEAVALHGGEAALSAREFFGLAPKERQQVEAFLKTLAAPVDHAGE